MDNSGDRYYFQQLQEQFAAAIRDPEGQHYAPSGEQPIEPRRLQAYQSLFYNNIAGFFSQLFPVCKQILGEQRWQEIMREYLCKHRAETPLFHELGEEFLAFLHNEFQPQSSDPAFLLELAHYEWVELALSVSTEQGFERQVHVAVDLQNRYALSPLAWLLAYHWPVHQLRVDNQPERKSDLATTLLAYRSEDDEVHFMQLEPLLYHWLRYLQQGMSGEQVLQKIATDIELQISELRQPAQQALEQLLMLGLLRPLSPV